MAPSLSSQNYTFDQCTRDFGEYYKDRTQDQLDSPMPWIVMYIAAASAACAIAMSADAVNGFRTKKLWFPCKYLFFSTVLAVSMKIPGDLTGRMKGTNDKLAQVSSLILMSTAMANFMASLGSMSNNEIMAGPVMCVTPGVVCLLMSLTLLEARIRIPLEYINLSETSSHYKWSTSWILFIQSIGVATGNIAPLLRWLNAAWIKSTKIGDKSFRDELKVEAYWSQALNHWRESPLPLKIGHHIFRKSLHDAKRSLLNLCIGVQILNVRVSKLVLLISPVSVKGLMYCYSKEPDNSVEVESRAEMDMDLSHYVVLLEGEAELPKRTLENVIRIGQKKQPKNLIELLRKSVNFNGVREFDNSEIRSLWSDKVLEILEQRECPTMDSENAARIEGWRAVMEQDNESRVASVPAMFPQTHCGHVTIEVES